MAEIKASAAQLDAEEYNSDEEEDEHDSDYDSYDGEFSDEDTAAKSDDSYTDYEGSDGQCPTSCMGDIPDKEDEDEEGLWAIRPQIPATSPTSIDF
ncbi:hypothetical protein LTR13_008473 [Exophiala sideris]|uniref:Uncharacterized protein n=1 Tax=Exophiala sideris TaxID=1016849 RepID=A0ABR0J101_9EURO|nr:hypothetical protein LTR13_008473 [Exophiala sideris]KAK5053655.1 hypothetical protein LTR69_009300 [Exophiala sideris]